MSAHPLHQSTQPQKPRLRILQYNVCKSMDVMAPMFQEPSTLEYDIIALQEPWKHSKKNQTHHPAPAQFHLCYPNKKGTPTRVCIYVNTKIPMTQWYSRVHSEDLVTVTLKSQREGQKTLHIHNIYNASPSQRFEAHSRTDRSRTEVVKEYSEISSLDTLRTAIARNADDEHLIVGDFNLHHPLWTDPGMHQHPEADALIDIINTSQLQLLTPEGMPTFKPRKRSGATTIDLTLATINTADTMVKCGITRKLNFDSDHEALVTELDRTVEFNPPREIRNWKKMDRKKFLQNLEKTLPIEISPIHNTETLDNQVNDLITILSTAAKDATPISKICPRSRPDMDPECREAIRKVRKLKRR